MLAVFYCRCRYTYGVMGLGLCTVLTGLLAQEKRDIIYSIIAQSGTKPDQVLLQWEVRSNNTSPIIIKRYRRPMVTPRLVLEAKTINVRGLVPDAQSFVDRGVPPGVYYYAVLTREQLADLDKNDLVTDQNYTSRPLILFDPQRPSLGVADIPKEEPPKEPPKKKKPKERVDELIAVNAKNSVLLSWAAASSETPIEYQIYRSLEPLHLKEKLAAATLLGTTRRRLQFKDSAPLKNQDVYYGVVVTNALQDPNFVGLELNRSYIKHRYTVSLPKPSLSLLNKLDFILANTYLRGRYSQCISQVNHFRYHPDANREVKAKASFFLGLCTYKQKSYRRAMKFFSESLVKQRYPKRASFWFERSIERLRL